MQESTNLNEYLKKRLLDANILPAEIEVNGKQFIVQEPVAAGFKGAVLRVTDKLRSAPRALKLCANEDYSERSFLSELEWASRLEPYDVFAKLYEAGRVSVQFRDGSSEPFVAFVEEWVDGYNAEEFLRKMPEQATVTFLISFVKSFCRALGALYSEELRHDDLHLRNVMISKPPKGDLDSEWRPKIIDMGSLKPADRAGRKSKDDHRHLVDHIVELHNHILRRKLISNSDRGFLKEVTSLLSTMLDDDASIALRDPGQIVGQFHLAYTRSHSFGGLRETKLSSPFEYISAEHIADDRILVRTFAESCPWLDQVAGPDPCLVTGPRGCGKSTIFRWLSLKPHLLGGNETLDRLPIVGFYISCGADLQNRIDWIQDGELAQRFTGEIIHYFNLVVTREVLGTLSIICTLPNRTESWGLGEGEEKSIHDFLLSELNLHDQVRIQGVSRFAQLLEAVEREMSKVHRRMLKGLNAEHTTPTSFISDLSRKLQLEVRGFQGKTITYLLDDYSAHRLPEAVQVVLNRIVFQRVPSHVFKVASEKYGTEFSDSLYATAEPARELIEIDCGREYLALDNPRTSDQIEKFAVELLNLRLKASGFVANAEQLLGKSHWEEGSLGRALASKTPGRKNDQYHGVRCVAHVCSGDISTLLLLYRRIFEKGHIKNDSVATVPKRLQHDAIVGVSRELFEAIRHYHPFGPEMYGIANAFGTLVRQVLVKGKPQKHGRNWIPSQCPRLEIDQDAVTGRTVLTEKELHLEKELLRRAIFIEMAPTTARHEYVSARRWHFRRIYLPSFGASLMKNNAVKRNSEWFKYFLTDPLEACRGVWKSWNRQNDSQQDLFNEDGLEGEANGRALDYREDSENGEDGSSDDEGH